MNPGHYAVIYSTGESHPATMSEALDPDYPFPNPRQTRAEMSVISATSSSFAYLVPYSLPQLAVKPWLIPPPRSTYLTNCQVVDSANGKLLDGPHTIQIKAGKFASVAPSNGFRYDDTDAVKVDMDGKFVCPGLIDAHVHVTAVPGTSVCVIQAL